MANKLQNEYYPDRVTSPGETLLETLETIGMSQAELAKRMGCPVKTINEIIQEKAAITPETAQQLEQVLHIPTSFFPDIAKPFLDAKSLDPFGFLHYTAPMGEREEAVESLLLLRSALGILQYR